MLKRRFFLGYSLLFLEGCTLLDISASTPNGNTGQSSQLHFAVTDLNGYDALTRIFSTFRQVLEDVLQMPVKFFAVDHESAAAPALLANEVDRVMAGPFE